MNVRKELANDAVPKEGSEKQGTHTSRGPGGPSGFWDSGGGGMLQSGLGEAWFSCAP